MSPNSGHPKTTGVTTGVTTGPNRKNRIRWDPRTGPGYSAGISMSMSKSPPEYLTAHHASSCSLEKIWKAWKKGKQKICITLHHRIILHHIYLHLVGFPQSSEKHPKTQTNVSSNYVACLKQYLKISPQKAPSNSWNSFFTQAAHGVPSGPLSHAFQWVRSLSTSWGPPAYPSTVRRRLTGFNNW